MNNFDWLFYKNFYHDLEFIKSENEAYNHWINFGIKEKRICNKDFIRYFDLDKYLLYNTDLLEKNINTEKELINHWLKYGRYENRIFFLKTKPLLKIKLSDHVKNNYLNFEKYYSMISLKQFINYFLPQKYDYLFIENKYEKSDISIWDTSLNDNSLLNDNEINIFICVENINHWNHYPHYNKYKNYNNEKMHIYLYNHITNIEKTDKYISIPMIHIYINYYLKNKINPIFNTSYKDKKFCLMINKSNLNKDINIFLDILNKIDKVDNISMYNILIKSKSCYHSKELITIFNKYKFILCIENSYNDGYITEKIFNCFFANIVPIYKGSSKINNYINKNRFINLLEPIINVIEQIKIYNSNEELYDKMINSNILSKNYNNENYDNEIINFIDNKI